jgi:lycopene cyclase domain-containing protein
VSDRYLYLVINFLSIIFPFLFSFHPKLQFYKRWKYLWPSILIPAIIFIAWDMAYTKLGVWGFNERYLTGIYFFNLPIEEVLFFICIPYACSFTYESVNVISGRERISTKKSHLISNLLSLLLIVIGLVFYYKLYTSVTFIACGLLILLLSRVLKADYLGRFYFAFIFILIPFFIVNGVLTGTGIDEEVVWYNNAENLGIRMGTIPIDDTFYGMLLILMNISLFEYFQTKKQVKVL